MLTPRAHHTATLLPDGRVLVAGGHGDRLGVASVSFASAELYDPATGSWTATGSMTTARSGHTATLLPDGRVLVVSTGVPPSAELYDPRYGTWTPTGSPVLAHESGHAAALLANGTVLIAGGPEGSMVRSTPAEVYDPRSGSWTAVESLNVGRSYLTLTPLLDGGVLAVGGLRYMGQDPAAERAAERYDPASRSWTFTGAMLERHLGQAATLLPDGRVLVTGGILLGDYMNATDPTKTTVEVYDPDTNSWTAAGRLLEVRRGHTATLLPGGTILMIGYQVEAPPELFDPVGGSSTATPPMAEPRSYHTATLLLDGTVLVTGGSESGSTNLASAELFHPISDP